MEQPHGGDIHAFAKQLNCQPSEVIDLSSNINFVKPKINLDFNSVEISAYPNYDGLSQKIARLYAVNTNELELFNGATTAIYTLFRTLALQHCTLYAPLYGEYEKSAKAYGYKIDNVNRFEEIEKEIKKNSLIIFVNPSTPDGKFYVLEKLMKIWIAKKCTIIIDESFLDFTPYDSATKYLKYYDKLYVLKSMTKFYAAAGIRVGAVLSCEKNILKLKEKEPLWKISQFDSHYLQSALQDKSFSKRSQQFNIKNKKLLIQTLLNFKYTQLLYPSASNFMMCKLKEITAQSLQEQLTRHKIMIRDCSNFHFLDKSHVRIAVKSYKNIKSLNMALQEIEL